MQLQFLQDLENLSLDGEAFLAQFLEFLLDRSLDGDTRFDSLIPSIAQVLDLKLPITTITSSFALLQVYIRQDKEQKLPQNQSLLNQNIKSPVSEKNFETSSFDKKITSQNERPDKENLSNLAEKPLEKSSNLSNNSPNPVAEQNEVKNEVKNNLANGETKKHDNPSQEKTTDQEIPIKTVSTDSPIQNFESETMSVTEKRDNNELKTENDNLESQIESQMGNIKTVTLSEVNTFLIRQIQASNENNLKLLLSDLSIATIDAESKTGILTLSSGALLNFLKTKRSLDWIANTLENEFGWKLHLTAQQRESKTVLFESTDVLVVVKNCPSQNIESYKPKEKIAPENKPHSTIEKPKITEKIKPEEPRNQETKTQTIEGDKKPENEPKSEPKKIFYTLFWPSTNPVPYNLSQVPTISKIDEPTSLDWEDLISDFEIE